MSQELRPLRTLLITGIPRSGTTLACALVDTLEDSVCLGEPGELFGAVGASTSSQDYVARVLDLAERTRTSLSEGGTARDRRDAEGAAITNYVGAAVVGGTRELAAEEHEFRRELTNDGLIAIKHNAPFLAVLPQLLEAGLPVVGVVRHPVPTIQSWLSVDLPVSKGTLPTARKYWPECERGLEGTAGLERLVRLYDMLTQRLVESGIPMIRHEELVEDPGMIEALTGRTFRHAPDFIRAAPGSGSADSVQQRELVQHAVAVHGDWALRLYPESQ